MDGVLVVGNTVGAADGTSVGKSDGMRVGASDGGSVFLIVGMNVGNDVGANVGDSVGLLEEHTPANMFGEDVLKRLHNLVRPHVPVSLSNSQPTPPS